MYVGKGIKFRAENVPTDATLDWWLDPPSAGTLILRPNNECMVVAGPNTGGALLHCQVKGTALESTATINLVPLNYAIAFPIVNGGNDTHTVDASIDIAAGKLFMRFFRFAPNSNDGPGGPPPGTEWNTIWRFPLDPASPDISPEAAIDPIVTLDATADPSGAVYAIVNSFPYREVVKYTPDFTFAPGFASPNNLWVQLAFGEDGNLYGVPMDQKVYRFNASGGVASSFSVSGSIGRWGLAVDIDGMVYVCSYLEIQRYFPDGTLDTTFDASAAGFQSITDIDVDRQGAVFVLDDSQGRVAMLDYFGDVIWEQFGLANPKALAVGPTGEVWVFDDTNEFAVPPFTIASALVRFRTN